MVKIHILQQTTWAPGYTDMSPEYPLDLWALLEGKEQLMSAPSCCFSRSCKQQLSFSSVKLNWEKCERHSGRSKPQEAPAPVHSHILMCLTQRALIEMPVMHISKACQHGMKTLWREALSKAITLLYLSTSCEAKPAFLTVSWQVWMDCAYVGGKWGSTGKEVWLFENICIKTFNSSSFPQVTWTVQGQIAFLKCSFGFAWNYQFADLQPSS